MPALSTEEAQPSAADSLIDHKVNAQIETFMAKTGLQFTGQSYFRPDEAIGIDEDDPVSPYRGKVQAELRWYFLQSSLYNREGQINELRLQGEKERLSQQKKNISLLHTRQQEAFLQRYDSLLYSVLHHRVQNLTLLSETQQYLLEGENISSDELLNILNEKAEAERMLTSIPRRYEVCKTFPTVVGILISIDTQAYLEALRSQHADLNMMALEMELLEQQKRNTSYWSDFRMAPFVRYSHYTRTLLPSSQNVDVGVSFTIPCSKESKHKRQVLSAEQELLTSQREEMVQKLHEEALLICEDMERNNRLLQGELVRLEELKNYLIQRNKAYRYRVGEYSRLSRMKEINTYLKCRESLLRYQYLRDRRLADLQSLLGDTPILNFCTITYLEY